MLENAANIKDVTELGWALVFGASGLFSAAHCAGMCGGFPIIVIKGGASTKSRLWRLCLYNLGRGSTYVILGTIAALLGALLGRSAADWLQGDTLEWVSRGLSLAIALAMLISGLFLLGVRLPFFQEGHRGFFGEIIAKGGRSLLNSKSPFAPLTVGALNGLLPCPMVAGILFSALNIGILASWQHGAAAAAGFALGTMPIMFAIGLLGSAISMGMRQRIAKLGGVALLVFAAILVLRSVSGEFVHDVIPGPHVHGNQVGAGMDFYDPITGVRIERREGQTEEEWQREKVEEHKLNLSLGEAFDEGPAALREVDARMSKRDHEKGLHKLYCYTVTKADLVKLREFFGPDEAMNYRCFCCGSVKQAKMKQLFQKNTLLFAKGENPLLEDYQGKKPSPHSDE